MGETVTIQERHRTRREPNPVLVRELRGRMRGVRAFVMLSVYLAALGCFTSLIYTAYTSTASGPGGWGAMAYAGKVLFSTVVLLEIFLVAFITPAFTAGAISGERERKTYEVLRTTLLPARRLVWGKLGAALAYILLLILTAVPLESLAFMLGGVVIEELVLALLILLATAFVVAAVGLFASTLARTTLIATVIAYGAVLLVVVGIPLLTLIASAVGGPFLGSYGPVVLPEEVQVVLVYLFFFVLGLSPITAAGTAEVILTEESTIWFFEAPLRTVSVWLPSPWLVYVPLSLLVGLVLVWLAIRRVRRQETR